MKDFFKELVHELDYHNEFTTEEAVVYTVLAIVFFGLALCGETIILNLF